MYIDAKCREDLSCNSIMYVRETRECHMGNSTLTNGNDDSEFVYRIPDGTGDMLQLLYKHLNMTYIGTAYREYGVVYKGKNFNETRGVASLEECIQMCKDSARCRFWWYEFDGNQRCCLKEGKSGKLFWGPGFVAGNKP